MKFTHTHYRRPFAILGLAALAICFGTGLREEARPCNVAQESGTPYEPMTPFVALGCVAIWGQFRRGPLRDSNPDPGGGGMSAAEFQNKTLQAIKEVKSQQDTIASNLATLDKEGKQLAEDFAKQAKEFEGLPGQVRGFELQIKKMEAKIANERRVAFGSAIDMIRLNEEINLKFNAIIRGTLASDGRKKIAMNDGQKAAWEAHKKAVTEGASPGSTYINDDLNTAIYSLIAEYGIWGLFDVIPASTKTTKLLVDSTDPVMGFVDEGTDPGEGSYTGTSVSATVKKMMAWLSVSNELLEDAEIDLTGHILRKFARATALRLDYMALSADGTNDAANGAFTGIFSGGTAAVAASGNVSVATLDFEDFLTAMLAPAASVLSRPGTRWFTHPQMLVRALKIKDLNGRPIFLPAIDAPSPGALGSICGYPVTLAHAAPNTDGVSKKIMTFGDPEGEAILLRKDLDVATSEHVKFTEDKTVFRGRARGAGKVKDATAFGVLTTAAS